MICTGSPHLVREIDLLLAVRLLFDFALLGQLLQRLHHRLGGGGGNQRNGFAVQAAGISARDREAPDEPPEAQG